MLQGLEVLLLLVACTLYEVHPVPVLWVTSVDEISQRRVLVDLVEKNISRINWFLTQGLFNYVHNDQQSLGVFCAVLSTEAQFFRARQ